MYLEEAQAPLCDKHAEGVELEALSEGVERRHHRQVPDLGLFQGLEFRGSRV